MKRIFLIALLPCAALAGDFDYRAIGYNIEGGYKPDAELNTVTQYIKQLGPADIYALSEVTISWQHSLAEAASQLAGAHFHWVATTGAIESTDSLAILYNTDKFSLIKTLELNNIKPGKYSRAPLAVLLKDNRTSDTFYFMVNHFDRKHADRRQEQARKLNEWAQTSEYPVVAMGDYNFDFEVTTGETNTAFKLFTKDDVFTWVKPQELIKSGCHEDYNSILDFAFIANGEELTASSTIRFPEPEYCMDDSQRPDHRPIELMFSL
ncbi:endonuclease/exonuclease/phosphatase family protein [uncultured Photobacterium sp.]|uniref:endonuclease/exonuclease/phosphatase family protein n=1 Tax=uncultured Photobacterium sp. TaxID=173973 RepID=UPI00261354AD|nr:endonuclease/exonuclease/phosphatase family protein [uncultured Photobacterium sp.]